ncbi:MAG: helix-turn-helix transcriptional regulator [Theionarchaea archaeon]|nr:helix-turn-helix transcriptional regulator [Theionarchaea archaeon]
MKNHCKDAGLCPITGIIDVVAKKWSICVVSLLGNHGSMRFNEIRKELKGISPKSLSDRLKELHEGELIQREVYAEVPLRVEYSLTEDGKSLFEALQPLMKWVRERRGEDSLLHVAASSYNIDERE